VPIKLPDLAATTATPSPPRVSGFAGLWLLPSGRNGVLPPNTPQYIQVRIYRDKERLFGEYAARYEGLDRPVSPEVTFHFNGPARGESASFDWNSPDGSHGAIELTLLTPQSMQVSWHVAEFGSNIRIAGGAAVVIRRAE
jgi:hypothetical protein